MPTKMVPAISCPARVDVDEAYADDGRRRRAHREQGLPLANETAVTSPMPAPAWPRTSTLADGPSAWPVAISSSVSICPGCRVIERAELRELRDERCCPLAERILKLQLRQENPEELFCPTAAFSAPSYPSFRRPIASMAMITRSRLNEHRLVERYVAAADLFVGNGVDVPLGSRSPPTAFEARGELRARRLRELELLRLVRALLLERAPRHRDTGARTAAAPVRARHRPTAARRPHRAPAGAARCLRLLAPLLEPGLGGDVWRAPARRSFRAAGISSSRFCMRWGMLAPDR
jgi:hypothetical protein